MVGGIDAADVTTAGSPQLGTINNDDSAVVTLVPGTVTVTEGDGGTVNLTFDVTLDNAVQGGFSVGYQTNDGTATAASGDYVDNDGGLNFVGTAGETQTITVAVNGDTIVEADETLTVSLGAITGLAGGIAAADVTTAGSPQLGTINNDDSATVTLVPGTATVTEGDAGTTNLTFDVVLDNAVQDGFNRRLYDQRRHRDGRRG